VIAPGRENIWICQVGGEATDGDFSAFRASIVAAQLSFEELNVTYRAPGVGALQFGWRGPLRLDGRAIPLAGYPRYDNPYLQAEFGGESLALSHAESGARLELDFAAGKRLM
jgi:hypothetical protein